MEFLLNDGYTQEDKNCVVINQTDDFINQENDIHISVVKPITKRTIHSECEKINAFYKPIELVEEVNTYVKKGEEYLVKLYENLKKEEKRENEEAVKKWTNSTARVVPRSGQLYNTKYAHEMGVTTEHPTSNIFNGENGYGGPKFETLFVPKLKKNIEIVNCLKENVNVDYTYLVPKPVVIPVQVPMLKFRDNFKIVPIRKKIIPLIRYTDEVIYVDCCVEKPYIVYENIIAPVPCDVPIEERKYIEHAPPVQE
ncbi:inner membrane complex protein 1d, putative [Plasmodium knowlesi strain H]|uniref:Inner membrane complex protein 1d, putative n=3 Tax=Plasmodium knowlesi TaxID=5850 RepID=A0A5K1U1S5_PLAKH|nr:inner membrane complex protein 1d, putative [Plasmodium knowlesi strain H]OTN68658.1 putative Heat shock protein - family 86 [Plasmodium knowlesi]CAA9986152.1 inner membrane complex protein 1d, putative [Plasmodium knowlesi strain H]SBO25337.1 inner membrane complex protein 1d, putative [Plasmodium knowlesi strain H]SBO27647.1 inner membrane complex protein 1d, putative [Plasmodium knowlesi strain H]VVS75626.1 inner membrane complex protein 1d, putative [Plasmodium knowlesi strain H]|eukprot:XP_002257563.1 heat shock protein, family 86, putative [Plasmodium knowlesi strain H]